MKKLIFIMLLGILCNSCASEDGVTPPSKPGKDTSELRAISEAISIADKHFASRAESARAVTHKIKDVSVIGSMSGRSVSDALIYAINYEDNAGFALVSALPNDIDIIGYADEGNFDVEKIEPGSNIDYFLGAAKDYVSTRGISIGDGPVVFPGNDPITQWDIIYPVLTVSWGQDYPEGMYCPNKLAGCTQTAMAQIMSYLQDTKSISLSYEGHDIATQYLNWAEIIKHTKSCGKSQSTVNNHLTTCPASLETHKALGRLCRQLGELNHAIYWESSTGVISINRCQDNIRILCPNKEVSELKNFNSDFSNLFTDLKLKAGIAFVSAGEANSNGAHDWVCDGAEDKIKISKELKYDGTYVTVTQHNYYYHYNWGWNGYSNGYFAAGVFDTSKGRSTFDFSEMPMYFVIYK